MWFARHRLRGVASCWLDLRGSSFSVAIGARTRESLAISLRLKPFARRLERISVGRGIGYFKQRYPGSADSLSTGARYVSRVSSARLGVLRIEPRSPSARLCDFLVGVVIWHLEATMLGGAPPSAPATGASFRRRKRRWNLQHPGFTEACSSRSFGGAMI